MQRALPAPKARERSGDRTRRLLFETAIDEFCRVGVEEASIGRIAKAAGVSRPTFYFHFPTKDHVLLELQWSYEEPIAARVASAAGLEEAFVALIDGIAEALGTLGNPGVFAEMVRIYTRHAASPALADQPHHLMRAVAARFVEAHSLGRLRDGLDPSKATHLFLTSVFGYLSLPTDPESARRELRTLISLYFASGPDFDAEDSGR